MARPIGGAEQPSAARSNDDLLAQAKTRIDQHRKGDGVITVRSANGQPVPDARVQIEQLRHDFLFGGNFFMFARLKDPEREEQYRQRFAALLNYATLGFYWPMYEPERGRPIYDYTDKVVDWARPHGITC